MQASLRTHLIPKLCLHAEHVVYLSYHTVSITHPLSSCKYLSHFIECMVLSMKFSNNNGLLLILWINEWQFRCLSSVHDSNTNKRFYLKHRGQVGTPVFHQH